MIYLNILFVIIILISSLMINPIVKAQDLIVIKGYIYIDDLKTPPDQITIIISGKLFPASTYDDASYIVSIYGVPIGVKGTFYVIYQGDTYYPDETFTVKKNVEIYNIDLHIDTSEGPQPPPPDPTNMQPKADTGGPYYEQIFKAIYFDGSDSYDSDGSITKYEWNFGDGTTKSGVTQTHTYDRVDTYIVTLTVTDNKGKTDLDITYAYVTEIPNKPPSKPVIKGINSGSVEFQYNYIITSTDNENDTIRYLIDWGDDTDPTASDFLQNGTIYTDNHSWTYPGIYSLRAYAIDDKEATSEQSEQVVLINTIYCKDIGYLTDYTDNSVYDLFYSNSTGEETPVIQVKEIYLIDDNNDGLYDYQFNMTTLEVSNYVETDTGKETSSLIDLISPFALYILIFIIIFLFLTMGFLVYKISKKPNKEKRKKIKNKEEKNKTKEKTKTKEKIEKEEQIKEIETKKEPVKSKERVKRVENKIDELLLKKKK